MTYKKALSHYLKKKQYYKRNTEHYITGNQTY